VLPVQGNVYLVTGAGGNIVVQAGPQGMVVVDTGLAQMSDKALATIAKLSPKKIQYIINTHVHPDHTGGNGALVKLNGPGAPPRIIASRWLMVSRSRTRT